jgi:hypothetical protein
MLAYKPDQVLELSSRLILVSRGHDVCGMMTKRVGIAAVVGGAMEVEFCREITR